MNPDTDEVEGDLGLCPYFAFYRGWGPRAVCSFGCRDEPSCVTDEPNDGWPSVTRAWACTWAATILGWVSND